MTKIIALCLAGAGVGAFVAARTQSIEKEETVSTSHSDSTGSDVDPEQVDWSQVDWSKRLTAEEHDILREAGTERAFTGEYWNHFEDGQYHCRGCGLLLFESDAKFDSHCGWPSFDEVVTENAVVELDDLSFGMRRIEVRCRRCGGHLGHVFNDGPTETGLRYCMNSASISFRADDESTPDDDDASASGAADAGGNSGDSP